MKEQGAPWETMKLTFPTLMDADLVAPEVFAAAVNVTVPSPVPDAPEVIVIQFAVVPALQAQGVETEKEPSPPLAGMFVDCGLRLILQTAPLSVTENDCPAMVRLPVRALAVGLGCTV